MLRFWKWSLMSCGLLTMVFTLSLSAADDKKEPEKTPEKTEAEAEEKTVDLDKLPEGSNEDLLNYIKQVRGMQPKSFEDILKMSKAIGKAADKILDSNPSEQELKAVLAIRMRLPMGPEESLAYSEKLKKIGAELTKSGKTEFGRQVTGLSFIPRLSACMNQPEEFQKAIGEAMKFLSESKLEIGDMQLTLAVAQFVERSGNDKFAAETLEKVVKMVKESKLEAADKIVKRLEGTLRRLKLLGSKIELEGSLLSGEKLDLAKYNGKVVLVDFWATWCGPCVAEIPRMKKSYEAYHSKGFEIIGLSCDENKETIEKFVKEKEIPWSIVFGDNAPSPSFEYYGISGIPTMILVGKDGKVVSTSARGEELDRLLEELLGPAEKKADTEKKADAEKKS